MSYIFLDESGDLGFNFSKKKTSKFFIITFLFAAEKKPLEKIVQKIFKQFSKIEVKNHHGVLHCYKELPITKNRLLNYLVQKNISIMYIYLNKKKVYVNLQQEKSVLYNYVTNILLDRVYTKKLISLKDTIFLIASRRETNKFLNENFKRYLQNQVRQKHTLDIKIEIKSPSEEKSLQVVDFCCWSIFRKIELKDESYYEIFKDKVIEGNPLYP